MKKLILILFFFLNFQANAQYKDGISIVQFTAEFLQDSKADLSKFKSHNTFTFFIEKDKKIFEKEDVIYMPTIMLFHNGEKITTIESDITLKLPENWENVIAEEIKNILSQKF